MDQITAVHIPENESNTQSRETAAPDNIQTRWTINHCAKARPFSNREHFPEVIEITGGHPETVRALWSLQPPKHFKGIRHSSREDQNRVELWQESVEHADKDSISTGQESWRIHQISTREELELDLKSITTRSEAWRTVEHTIQTRLGEHRSERESSSPQQRLQLHCNPASTHTCTESIRRGPDLNRHTQKLHVFLRERHNESTKTHLIIHKGGSHRALLRNYHSIATFERRFN